MRIQRLLVIATAALAVGLTGCSGPNGKQDTGLAVGALAGGIIGNQVGKGKGNILATVAGAVVGGIVGSEIGKSMDKQDQQPELAALERGQSGVSTPWRNPENGRYGEVVPSKPYRRGPDDCRDYTHTIYVDNRPQTMRGTACRNNDGTWRNVG
jgi:surface antigen